MASQEILKRLGPEDLKKRSAMIDFLEKNVAVIPVFPPNYALWHIIFGWKLL